MFYPGCLPPSLVLIVRLSLAKSLSVRPVLPHNLVAAAPPNGPPTCIPMVRCTITKVTIHMYVLFWLFFLYGQELATGSRQRYNAILGTSPQICAANNTWVDNLVLLTQTVACYELTENSTNSYSTSTSSLHSMVLIQTAGKLRHRN